MPMNKTEYVLESMNFVLENDFFLEKSRKCPGYLLMDVLEKPKNVLESPGKSWKFEFKMLWPP